MSGKSVEKIEDKRFEVTDAHFQAYWVIPLRAWMQKTVTG